MRAPQILLFRVRLRVLVFALALFATIGAARAESVLEISESQRAALAIEVVSVEPTPLVSRPPLPGRVLIPNDRVAILAMRTEGVVLSLSVATGDRVTAGQPVALIGSPTFVLLQREFLDALSQRDLASATFERERQLAREGIVAGRRAVESQARLQEADARVEERRQGLILVGMDQDDLDALASSRRMHSAIAVRAPVDGFVLEQWAQVGERLEAGSPLYRVGRLDALHVEIHVPLELAQRVRVGSRFQVVDRDASGTVIAVGRDVHAVDQGVLVRGAVDQGVEVLRPGQFVRVALQTETDHDMAYDVPASAVTRIDQRAFVFRRVGEGFEPVAVEIVGGSGQRSMVAGELSPGDAVVSRGTAALKSHWLSQGGPD
jgi:RND family efflux transporter MFP subunit